jgi:acyl-CoA thioester hydrolase
MELYNAEGAAMLCVPAEQSARIDPRCRKPSMTHKPRLLVHTSRQSIRWGDMDALGHVNNVTYFRYLEQARIEWVYALHPAGDAYESSDPVIVNASCTFLEPLVYPGDIEVRMYLGEPGRTSIGSYYEIWMNGRKYAEGAAKIVWIDLASGRSVPVPDAVAAPLRALETK